ncbi:MAG: acyl-CoA dehydratase activase [Thermodesulfobacteriota bacterium]
MGCVLGIDLGSATSKGVLMEDGAPRGTFLCPSGGDFRLTAERVRECLLQKAGGSVKDVGRTVATGYGAQQVFYADEVKPEISCHGRGVFSLFPSVRTVIDVGDLYTKVFRIDERGSVVSFLLSGKCAGGSGRLLQIIARVLQVRVEEIGPLSLLSRKRVDFGTGCVVFAESEAISRIAEGAAKEDLLAGIHRALAAQINSLLERMGVEAETAMVGGGARDAGLVKALEEMRGHSILVPPEPQMTGALGAAIIASET